MRGEFDRFRFNETQRRVASTWGGRTGEEEDGYYKWAYYLGDEKVMLVHKENGWPRRKQAEYAKAKYYVNQIFHELMPKNFLEVRLSSENNVMLVDRVPETSEFTEIKRIARKGYKKGTPEENKWYENKAFEMGINSKFNEIVEMLNRICLSTQDIMKLELVEPNNTVMVNGEPVVIDLVKPVADFRPLIREDKFLDYLSEKMDCGDLDEKRVGRILRYYQRYRENVDKFLG